MSSFLNINRYHFKALTTALLLSCSIDAAAAVVPTFQQEAFKNYWYAGDAELTSYKLKQARYGELREGSATLIFVTESFLPKEQVKADNYNPSNLPALKLNKAKTFLTGLYPYSIMTSTFSPISSKKHAIKVSNTTQEWCGNSYSQMNNVGDFAIKSHTYFEGEADREFTLSPEYLEDELWTKIRLTPNALPVGKMKLVPSFEYIRLLHIDFKAYDAILTLKGGKQFNDYTVEFPELKRTLTITFNRNFPYVIEGWTDTYKSGFDEGAKVLTSSAQRITTIKEKYWQLHGNKHEVYRDTLGYK